VTVPACTFAPRRRGRLCCNVCEDRNGKSVIVKRAGAEAHRRSAFARNNPRPKTPPMERVEKPRPKLLRQMVIYQIAMHWRCPECHLDNFYAYGYDKPGHESTALCYECGAKFSILRTSGAL
jgi:hypothetical protein